MQVLMDPVGHVRSANNDEEILRRIEALALSGTVPRLVTGDYGMQLRAESRGMRCLQMPDKLRLKSANAPTSDAEAEGAGAG